MTFLYLTLVAIAALVILYIVGCIIAFCLLFFVIGEHKKEYLVEDMLYSLGSYLTILFMVLCWAASMEEDSEKHYN